MAPSQVGVTTFFSGGCLSGRSVVLAVSMEGRPWRAHRPWERSGPGRTVLGVSGRFSDYQVIYNTGCGPLWGVARPLLGLLRARLARGTDTKLVGCVVPISYLCNSGWGELVDRWQRGLVYRGLG